MRLTTLTMLLCLGAISLLNPVVGPPGDSPVNGLAWADEPPLPPEIGAPTIHITDPTVPPVVSTEPVPPMETGDAVKAAVDNVRQGNWKLAVAALLSLLMTILSKVRSVIPLLQGDRGGAATVMLLSLMGAFATALMVPGVSVNLNLVLTAIGVAFTAVGGWTWFWQIWKPADKRESAQG